MAGRELREVPDQTNHPGLGYRHIQIVLLFGVVTISILMRTDFSLALVAMTNNSTSNPNIEIFEWNNTSVILSAFFWGYFILQLPSGMLSKKYGPKTLLLPSFFLNNLTYALIPVAASYTGDTGVMALRMIQGISQSCMFPCAHTTMGRWCPREERNRMGIIVYSGVSCGPILGHIATGFLCSSDLGWPSAFYVFSACGFLWCILYFFLASDSPASHRRISLEERTYIQCSLSQSTIDLRSGMPWKDILTCVHFWAIVAGNLGGAWVYTYVMTQIPRFYTYIIGFDMKSNGIVCSIPYMAGAITGPIYATIADYLIGKKIVRRITSRKFFQSFGAFGFSIFLLCVAYLSSTKVLSVAFLSMGQACYTATMIGYALNHMDLSPKYAGVMVGISNGISQFAAGFSPLIVQFIVTDKEDIDQWRICFIISAALYSACGLIYLIFASSTRQEFDMDDEERIGREQLPVATK